MATKVPIYLKRGSRKGKKEKLRDILSSDMISPPLGDFRHTIHVGSGGQSDTFGDISFLQGQLHLLPRGAAEAPPPLELPRTATVSGGEAAAPSPLLKNAISLPALGAARALTLPAEQAPPKPPRLHLDEAAAVSPSPSSPSPSSSSPCPRLAANGEAEPLLSHAGSLLSLHVDLGPSILEDVLQVMERHRAERGAAARTEILT
ncbi:cdc42 effector protein 2 [Haemorhous mexicanus]|uniref:cdc42 effector protein 2 n=1 Tax=Haemorhous mexicanus TaxID=30427 RepID=UPI0028BD5024|nr:cdc42 effector protein 2 [Haemorhous mexicanus]XP_059728394.1 cdc42 effector protein 2 [Haemorhous mexicanus]